MDLPRRRGSSAVPPKPCLPQAESAYTKPWYSTSRMVECSAACAMKLTMYESANRSRNAVIFTTKVSACGKVQLSNFSILCLFLACRTILNTHAPTASETPRFTMSNVLAVGLTGCIGSAFAHQLFRSGNHEVKAWPTWIAMTSVLRWRNNHCRSWDEHTRRLKENEAE